MVRFDRPTGPTPYLNQRSQIRMLAMVATLVFVLVAIQWAAKPQSWYWLLPPKQTLEVRTSSQPSKENAPVRMLSQDEILVLNKEGSKESTIDSEDELKEDSLKPTNRTVFDLIDDNVVGIREKEIPALVELIKKIDSIQSKETSAEPMKGIGFPNLVTEPERYRGELLPISGEIVRIAEMSLPLNRLKLESIYDIWVQTSDSGQDLYRVLVKSLPKELTIDSKDRPAVPVKFQALFFKRFGYESVNGQRLAPLLVASKIEPIRLVTANNQDMSFVPYLLTGAGGVALLVLMAVFYFRNEDKRFREREKARQSNSLPESFEVSETESNLPSTD